MRVPLVHQGYISEKYSHWEGGDTWDTYLNTIAEKVTIIRAPFG